MGKQMHVKRNDFAHQIDRLVFRDQVMAAVAIDAVLVESGAAEFIDQRREVLPQPRRKIVGSQLQEMDFKGIAKLFPQVSGA
jgi:hypothetical protein